MNHSMPLPADIRFMQATTALLLLGFVALVLAMALLWCVRLPLFAIGRLSLQGEVMHVNEVTVRANVVPQLSGGLFGLDLKAARQAFEALPWVRRAVVRREFPNGLRVQLQEHHAVAFWGPEDEPALLNNFGEVFEANVGEVDADNLPRLDGPSNRAAEVLLMYQQLRPQLALLDFGIDVLELSNRGAWRMQLDNGAVVELGTGSAAEIHARIDRFVHSVTQVAARHGRRTTALESADLRYAQGYALKLQGIGTVSGQSGK